MPNYQTLLFDIDNTLLDFGAAEDSALQSLFKEQQLPFSDDIKSLYKEINQGLWKSFEEGTIDRSQVLNTRFSLLFKEHGKEVDGVLFGEKYRNYLNENHTLIEGALELVNDLHQDFDLYVVTNGVSKTQYRRLDDSGLLPLFKDIFVSEDSGYQKPMREYFDYVFDRIPNIKKETTLIIGDSLTADIKGGQTAGVDTCWFNPHKKPNTVGIEPTYQISSLEELYRLLGVSRVLV